MDKDDDEASDEEGIEEVVEKLECRRETQPQEDVQKSLLKFFLYCMVKYFFFPFENETIYHEFQQFHNIQNVSP